MHELAPLPSVAVVIPSLNEESSLAATLRSVREQGDDFVSLIIADGGSTDGTKRVAVQHGAHVVETSRRGRGCQIAEVLSQVREDIVLILHADMILPHGALEQMRHWLMTHPCCPGGCLGHRFIEKRRIYRLIEWCDRRRARRGISYGDQAQFFRRALIERHGGFPDQPIMEDLELSRRLVSLGTPAYLDCRVEVSSRRFERLGWWRTVVTNLLLRRSYRRGGLRVCQALLQRYYHRSNDGR